MELFFRKMGSGPPLIIVHGLYGASDNWVTVGKALSGNFEVYLIDQRNHGNSPHSGIHNYDVMKNDLLEFMDKYLIKKAVFLGHSMGGKTIMFFAAEHPERVNGLIVVDISPRSYKVKEHEPKSIDHITIMDTMLSVDFDVVQSRKQVENKLAETISSKRIRQFLLKNVHRTKKNQFSWKLNVQALKQNLPAILDGLDPQDFMYGDPVTGFPVLFIKGEKSDYISEKDQEVIGIIFPYAEVVSIPKAGHWVHAEQTELFLETVLKFILNEYD